MYRYVELMGYVSRKEGPKSKRENREEGKNNEERVCTSVMVVRAAVRQKEELSGRIASNAIPAWSMSRKDSYPLPTQ